jgi:predicted RNase H-like HicB family nuclease
MQQRVRRGKDRQLSVKTYAAADRADFRVEVGPAADAPLTGGRLVTMIAVYDGKQWASLSPELDIASVGEDSDEALSNLESAIREAVAFAKKAGLEPGRPTPESDLLDFMRSHTGVAVTVGTAIVV